MKLTIMARITGGFGVITLFLLIIGITGFRSIISISDNLSNITDEILPMTLLNSETESQLLQVNEALYIYSKAERLDELSSIKTVIETHQSIYNSEFNKLSAMIENYPAIASPMTVLSNNTEQYFSEMKLVFALHKKVLQSKELKESIQEDLEDTGDELDTLVLDYADETQNRKIKTSLDNIGSIAGDAVITSIDALNESALSDVQVSARELDTFASSLDEKITTLAKLNRTKTEKKFYAQLLPLVNKFKKLISGSDSLLNVVQTEISTNDKSNTKMTAINELVIVFLGHSDTLAKTIRTESEHTKDVAESNVSSSRLVIIVASIISIGVAILVAFWVIKSIRVPLANVNRVLQNVSKGDLTQQITVINDDELGELSGWVNDLVTSLRSIIENIKQNSNKLSEAAENTSVITNQTRSNIQQQRSQTSHILEAMEQMTSAVEEVAQSASSTATEVDKAHQQTTDGTTIVNANIKSITELAEEIDGAAKVINELDEYSRNIDNVLDVIKGIAEQTNLLALNAAIEAARAGEQGRGFAVVADEVRTLASRTQQSTSEIQEMIERLQSGANEAVGVMVNSQKKAASSVDDIQKTGELLATITDGISIINDMSTHIATATEQQASVTEEVHTNVDTIAHLADETAQGADKTLDSSVLVAELSEQLQASVNHFKI